MTQQLAWVMVLSSGAAPVVCLVLSEDARNVLVLQTAGDIVSSTLQMKKVWSSCKALRLLLMYQSEIHTGMLPNYLIMFLCRQQYQNKTIIVFLLKSISLRKNVCLEGILPDVF